MIVIVNRRIIAGAVFLAGLLPTAAAAQQLKFQGSLFETYYKAAGEQVNNQAVPHKESMKFIVKAMNAHLAGTFTITETDIRAALSDDHKVCNPPERKLTDMTACNEFIREILILVNQEREVQDLADHLVAIANGSELAVADEPHRPLAVGPAALMFAALWTGTGATSLGWPDTPAVQSAVTQLNNALMADPEHLDQAVMRYHHGLLRMNREDAAGGSSGLEQYGGGVKNALQALASALGINASHANDPQAKEFSTPELKVPNVALWARKDDIGLHFIYPTHMPRFDIKLVSPEYPWHYYSGGTLDVGYTLSYPYRYRGYLPIVPAGLDSPLCDRVSGREGYLCRPMQVTEEICASSSSSSSNSSSVSGGSSSSSSQSGGTIVIRTCKEREYTIQQGPEVCSGAVFQNMFSLRRPPPDPVSSSSTSASTSVSSVSSSNTVTDTRVCLPRTETTFSGTIIGNSCYISLCVKESFSGHTIVGGRNPIAAAEPAQPYLACLREDPHLGMVAELPPISSSVLPQYVGPDIVRSFQEVYCNLSGQYPPYGGLAAFCEYSDFRRKALPMQTLEDTAVQAEIEKQKIDVTQKNLLTIAVTVGQRASLDQGLPIYHNIARGMAQTIQAIADLFLELKSAPLTTTACPWNGELDADDCGTQPFSP